jgi:hypothetical protein
MPGRKSETTVQRARRWLSGGALTRDDSDDELGQEDLPWEWVYESSDNAKPTKKRKREDEGTSRTIIAARMGSFECKIGDAVFLKSADNQAWVGIVCLFRDNDEGEKEANFMWFSSPAEIRNKAKKRMDFDKVSLLRASARRLLIPASVERTIHFTFMGLESFVIDKRHCIYYVKGEVPPKISQRDCPEKRKGTWQDFHL